MPSDQVSVGSVRRVAFLRGGDNMNNKRREKCLGRQLPEPLVRRQPCIVRVMDWNDDWKNGRRDATTTINSVAVAIRVRAHAADASERH